MSFACPHFDLEKDFCLALEADCVPGRPGCVLRKNSVFYVPAEERLRPQGAAPKRKAPLPARRAASKRG